MTLSGSTKTAICAFGEHLLLCFVALALSSALTGCAPRESTKHYLKQCVLPEDQTGTLSARWKKVAVPIAFQQGQFDASELNDMIEAANTWNDFYAQSLGLSAIDYGDPANPRQSSASKPSELCSMGLLKYGQFTGAVVIYKQSRWPYSNLSDAIALTTFCKMPATPLPYMSIAITELNYQYFFVSGRKLPDLQTIVLHEFGHMMGLNHSCEMTSKAGTPNCTHPSINPDYLSALMYPVFGFDSSGLGEQKRVLNTNDQGRANCLYQDMSTLDD
ncbi:MAG TPA: hypothetical protein VJB59_14510 [Bdellovibrionota bacterium]|nr:hypothetical protein [Bdellovibrionota bacterium]